MKEIKTIIGKEYSKKSKWILVLIGSLMILLSISPVLAATGTFDSVGGLIPTSYVTGGANNNYPNTSGIYIMNIQNQTGLDSIFVTNAQGFVVVADSSTPVDLYAGNTIIGTGQFGFSYSATTGYYTAYLFVNSLNIGTLTGNHYINFTTIDNTVSWNLNGLRLREFSAPSTPVNSIQFRGELGGAGSSYLVGQTYTKYQSAEFHNTYVTTYTSPISIINVTKIVGGFPYPSKVYIMQGTTELASNTTLNTDVYTANIAGAPFFSINVSDMWGNWYVSPFIYGSGTAPVYNISVLPSNITTSTSASGGIISDLDPLLHGITGIEWKWNDENGDHAFYDSGNILRPLNYVLKTGTWYGYDAAAKTYSISKGTAIPNPVSLSGIPSTGVKTVICYIVTSDGNYYTLAATLTVGGGSEGYGRILIRAIDWISNDQVSGADINIKNLGTDIWSNETTVTGRREFYAPIGTRLFIEGYKSGYDRANIPMYQIQGLMDSQTVSMFPTGSGSKTIANTTLFVSTFDAETYDLRRGVTVTVRNDGQVKVTDNSGTVSFTVLNGTAYTVRAGCSANDCVSQIKTETITGSAYTMQFYLDSLYATTIPTVAPGHTAVPTAAPTLDVRTNEQKGEGMVKMLYDNGESIVMLCILMTIFGLLGIKFGK